MNTYIEQKYEYISEKEISCFFNENVNFIKNVVSKFIFSKIYWCY